MKDATTFLVMRDYILQNGWTLQEMRSVLEKLAIHQGMLSYPGYQECMTNGVWIEVKPYHRTWAHGHQPDPIYNFKMQKALAQKWVEALPDTERNHHWQPTEKGKQIHRLYMGLSGKEDISWMTKGGFTAFL